MEVTAEHAGDGEVLSQRQIFSVIGASSVGTMIEWYDFYIFGSLATVIALHFYPTRQHNGGRYWRHWQPSAPDSPPARSAHSPSVGSAT